MQGYRNEMEDHHAVHLSMPNHENAALFGVFDGHSGSRASEYCALHLPFYVNRLKLFTSRRLCNVIQATDDEICATDTGESGTTCVFAISEIIDPETCRLTICNVGDSRALVLGPDGAIKMATRDHKPQEGSELRRILAAREKVERGRVNGKLAVARALGDAAYKCNPILPPQRQAVCALPDVYVTTVNKNDILLLACDGLFEQWSNEQLASRVMELLKKVKMKKGGEDLTGILRALFDQNKQSKDNMTAIMVLFKNGTKYNSNKVSSVIRPPPRFALPFLLCAEGLVRSP